MDGSPVHPRAQDPGRDRVGMLADGMTADEIVDASPDLEPADVPEALRYAAEAVWERELPLAPAG